MSLCDQPCNISTSLATFQAPQHFNQPCNISTSLNTLVQLVANGMGTTLVPEVALPQLVDNNPKIAKVPLAEPGPHREIAFVLRPNFLLNERYH